MTLDEILGLADVFAPIEIGNLRFEIGLARDGEHADRIAIRAIDIEDGMFKNIREQTFDVRDLLAVDVSRGRAFATGCAAARRRVFEKTIAAGEDTGFVSPDSFFLPGLVRKADLVSPEQFEAALVEPGGVRQEVELEDFVAGLGDEHAEAAACLRDATDVQIADVLINIFSRRYTNKGSLKALDRIRKERREHLAPLLIAYLDISVDSINHRFDGKRETTKRQMQAFELLREWSKLPPGAADRWTTLL